MRNINFISLGLILVLLFGVVLSEINPNSTTTTVFPKDYLGTSDGFGFVIFFTGDIKGNFEPCG